MEESAAAPQYGEVVKKPFLLALALASCADAGAQQPLAALSPAFPPLAKSAVPPLPFRYIGRLRQDGRTEVLLMRGPAVYSIARGGQIDGDYRVDRITDSSIGFTYLPLGAKQDLKL